MFHDDQWMWGMHAGWWILALVVLIALFWTFSRANRRADSPTPTGRTADDPIDVLKRKYASGEISTEEYEERKQTLERE